MARPETRSLVDDALVRLRRRQRCVAHRRMRRNARAQRDGTRSSITNKIEGREAAMAARPTEARTVKRVTEPMTVGLRSCSRYRPANVRIGTPAATDATRDTHAPSAVYR